MSTPPPIKPPRGVKYGKESTGCGLLVTVIKTLDASETNEERQKEKIKIDKEFKKTDKKLNDLVAEHDGDLTKVMQLFGQVSTQVTTARNKIHSVKENLQTCKQLLRCRREELQKLWMDAVQQKYVLEMLEEINQLQKVAGQVQVFINKKHYLSATTMLMQAIELSEGSLKCVEGLNDLRQDLDVRKQQLYTKLIDELNKHLYHLCTTEILSNFQRQRSIRTSTFSAGGTSPFQRSITRRSAERAEANTKIRKALFEMAQGYDVEKTEIIEDAELLDPDLNATYFIGIIVECFALLKKVPESLEIIKSQITAELLTIVTKTSQHIKMLAIPLIDESINAAGVSSHPLLDLIDLLFKQFKLIGDGQNILLKNYLSVIQRYGITAKPYDIADYWFQAQGVFQLLLTDYLDIQNTDSEERPTAAFAERSTNINQFFSRRKLQSKKTLFKFDKSSITNNLSLPTGGSSNSTDNLIKEHRRNASDMSNDEALQQIMSSTSKYSNTTNKQTLVCQPNSMLIRKIYLPLICYVHEMEQLMKCKSGQPGSGSLNTFLSGYVKETFLAKGHNRTLQLTIESLSKNNDAWRSIITPEEMKNYGLSRPLLQSTVLFENRITETRNLIQDLPDHSEDLLKMVCSLLKTYRETCQAAYRGIVQPETEDKRIYSVAWLKDDDITRFLKSLPNWTDLKTSSQRSRVAGGIKSLKTNVYMTSEEESPTQIQQRNIREAEMLTSNLGESGISQHEILSDIGVLKELAILQESMEWFSGRITEFANDLRKPSMNGLTTHSNGEYNTTAPIAIKDGTIKVLTNLALEFEDLANTCLLVLHLEVRVQCFHYLKANASDKIKSNNPNKSDSLEPDSKVLKLTKVLSEMDEALMSTLHPRKTKYIFEGLSHLAARILINASNYMETIDQAGVQRMCRNALALQQILSSITASREVALDHARNFYEMLYMDPEEILTTIIERGAQYTELQYLNALQLSYKEKGRSDTNMLATYQQKLSDILGTKPATGVIV